MIRLAIAALLLSCSGPQVRCADGADVVQDRMERE